LCLGFLQNYLDLEPAHKDGYGLPLLGMMNSIAPISAGR
jgi:hypothetical protein